MSEPLWRPSEERIARANITRFAEAMHERHGVPTADYRALHRWSVEDPVAFWSEVWDSSGVVAAQRGDRVLCDGERMPGARWFPEARLNYAENLLRRRDEASALVFRGEDRVNAELTFAELYDRVSVLSQALRAAGLRAGDRVAGYLPNMPEALIAMLASASIGAVWSSCSPDFGVQGVVDRFGQIAPRVLFGVDGYFFNGKRHDTLSRLAEVVARIPSVERVVVVPYTSSSPEIGAIARAVLWEDFVAGPAPAPIRFEPLPFDHPLFVMYSSGTTGPPKCIVHGHGGTLLQHLKEHRLHSDLRPGDRLMYFTTCGWMMWNWLVSALASGVTLLLYDGSPTWPDAGALFDFAQDARMTHFGTSAKYLDAIRKSGLRPVDSYDLDALGTMLSTGSPLVPESFDFVYESVKADLYLSSISGGTDIISCFVLGNPALPVYRGEIQCFGLGMDVAAFDEQGKAVVGEKGELVCRRPFPSMPIGFWNDPDGSRYRAAYFEKFPGVWCHGDYVECTPRGGLVIYGRSDAVLNPGGVRIGTAEIYRPVEQLDEVVEGLVIAQRWEGDNRIVLFVVLKPGLELDEGLCERIRLQVRTNASPRHVPARIVQVSDIPRTRSGKIVELAVRNVVHGEPVKNQEALANPEALEHFRDRAELAT